jgi:hypothetical protein
VTKNAKHDAPSDLIALIEEIVNDSEVLAGQQLRLLRCELRGEAARAGEAALLLGAGTGLAATGGVFSMLALVHALHRATRLPLWSGYGVIGGVLGAAGAGLLAAGKERIAGVRPPPLQTMSAPRENLEWLKEQVSSKATERPHSKRFVPRCGGPAPA